MSECIFCDILSGKLPSSVVYKDDRCTALMDIQPVNPGHVFPRLDGDGFGFKFPPGYSNKPERSELDAIALQITKAL